MVHLWHKHEAESQGGAEYYEHRDEHEGGVPLLLQDGWDGHTQHAHDHHVIETHANILHVARGKYVTIAEARGQTFRIDNEDPGVWFLLAPDACMCMKTATGSQIILFQIQLGFKYLWYQNSAGRNFQHE